MKYNKKCECCGHLVTAYSHNINAQMVQALEQLVNFYDQKKKGCNLQKNLSLSKNQYNNFQKLQYFGLVVNTETGWIPTAKAQGFMQGIYPIDNPVATFGKEVMARDHEAWKTAEKKPKLVYIHQIKNYVWKNRPEYKAEKDVSERLF